MIMDFPTLRMVMVVASEGCCRIGLDSKGQGSRVKSLEPDLILIPRSRLQCHNSQVTLPYVRE